MKLVKTSLFVKYLKRPGVSFSIKACVSLPPPGWLKLILGCCVALGPPPERREDMIRGLCTLFLGGAAPQLVPRLMPQTMSDMERSKIFQPNKRVKAWVNRTLNFEIRPLVDYRLDSESIRIFRLKIAEIFIDSL